MEITFNRLVAMLIRARRNRLTRRTGRAAGLAILAVALLALTAGACAKKKPPIARPTTPPSTSHPTGTTTPRPPAPPEPVSETPAVVPPDRIDENDLDMKSLEELNKQSPLMPVFFGLDSASVEGDAQTTLNANADVLRRYATWVVTLEGHCDERGTAEYNLALGERRALAARDYLVSLGIPASRLRTVSYGKEFPFAPGAGEEAYSKNRRAHFVITAK